MERDERQSRKGVVGTNAGTICRILVVEDFAPFLQFISTTLATRHDLQVICEVSDGLAAVRKAEELRPDLILLDIGLPSLNGIEAAPLMILLKKHFDWARAATL
jgi:DNA-binding NarL/FixJ family response regulator